MSQKGYYSEPSVNGDHVVFVADDDIWSVALGGGKPVRLTSNLGILSSPILSPDGLWIGFVCRFDATPEIYIMPSDGGALKRMTFMGTAAIRFLGWTPDSKKLLFASPAKQPFRSHSLIYSVSVGGGLPENAGYSWGSSISFGPDRGVVLGRHGRDPAQWKRYRGGRMGEIWIDRKGDGNFRKLLDLPSNLAYPLWIRDRIYFIGDHEGIGNIYSCDLNGENVQRHTDHDNFYTRNSKTDGQHLVYQSGGDLFALSIDSGETNKIDIAFTSHQWQILPKFVKAQEYLESYDVNPGAESLAVIARGKPFTFAHWEGAVRQYGTSGGSARYRLVRWLNDNKRIVVVSDATGDERLEIHYVSGKKSPVCLEDVDFGRAIHMEVNPAKDEVVITNQRQEIMTIDLDTGEKKIVDRSEWGRTEGVSWSPDGRWIAYDLQISPRRSVIKIYHTESRESQTVTRPVLRDFDPVFDPSGKYLYFLSMRVFDPVTDNLGFSYGFPKGIQPMVVALRENIPSPFIPTPKSLEEETSKEEESQEKIAQPVHVDFEGITNRIDAFPISEGRYSHIRSAKNRVYVISNPVEGTLSQDWLSSSPRADGVLYCYDFTKLKFEMYLKGVSNYRLSKTGKTIVYRSANKLRVIKAKDKPEKDEMENKDAKPGRESGWIDLNRIKVSVIPREEWKQMYFETWRLLRDHYYTPDMANVDWESVCRKYQPLLDRISTRAELSDLLWELGGELGTSHCYEIGGDYYRKEKPRIGSLGADIRYVPDKGFIIEHIVRGDPWDDSQNSPLNKVGVDVDPGDILTAINGRSLSEEDTPEKLLDGYGGEYVTLTITKNNGKTKDVLIKTIIAESSARLREWINRTTKYVHEKTDGRIGYIYMQDMGSMGYSQFHRAFLAEVEREGLIVDVRNNAGGHI
ncbi:PDZ domain-containing protein, partial [bacterium]|nr:PDZ domain-containing protein [candidate division CSSED10-310 bacterium]